MKRLPKRLFVRWQNEEEDPFLQVDTSATRLLTVEEIGEESDAGIYELKTRIKIRNKTEVLPQKKRI